MPALSIGQKAPAFKLQDQHGTQHSLQQYKGQWLVLYAYPKDLTPGCSLEAQDFTAHQKEFEKINVQILGISPDSMEKHQQFCDKKDLTLTLLSDPDHGIIEKWGAWQLKKFMGREFMGVVRSTWLIDPQGKIAAIWSPVKVKGHAQAVLECVQSLKQK